MEYLGHITFKGELHTIPAGAALVLKVDRHLTTEQMQRLKEHCRRTLGPDRSILVLGPGIDVMALDRLPVVNMGMDKASGPDREARATTESIRRSIADWFKVPAPEGDPMEATRSLVKKHGGGSGG